MHPDTLVTLDAKGPLASVADRLSEVIARYPASAMGEPNDECRLLQVGSPLPMVEARDVMTDEGRFRLVEMKHAKRDAMLLDDAGARASRQRAPSQQLAAGHLTRKEPSP